MHELKIEELVLEFLSEGTNSKRREEIKQLLVSANYDPNELEVMLKINSEVGKIPVPEPSSKMDETFYKNLNKIKSEEHLSRSLLTKLGLFLKSESGKSFVPKLAYGLALLVIGWVIGNWTGTNSFSDNQISQMSAELRSMKQIIMMSMLKESSPSKRIRAIGITREFDDVDANVVNSLLGTLNRDPNVNVRLVAVEALYEFASNPTVREGLIKSISKQKSPLVQLALADIMVVLQEKKSVEQFQILLSKIDLNDGVRNRIEKSIQLII